MLVCSCSSGEDGTESEQEWPAFTLDKTEVEIYAHETAGIIPSEAFTAWSENEKVATVDTDGTIHGISEGVADIVFKANASGKETRCLVKVSWRYHYYEEPILIFDSNPDEIKSLETHELISEKTGGNGQLFYLTYNYNRQSIPMLVTYEFNAWYEMKTVSFKWDEAADTFDEIKAQLDERYGDTEDRLPRYSWPYRTYYIAERYTFIVHTPLDFHYELLY